MLRNIHLDGWMAEHCGMKTVKLAVSSVGEAIRALEANFPGIKKKVSEGQFQICRGPIRAEKEEDLKETQQLTAEECGMNFEEGDFHITPVLEGGGESTKGWIMLIVGIILMAISFYYFPAGSYLGQLFMSVGLSLIFGGISDLLTPTPSTPADAAESDRPAENKSFLFNSAVNTVEQGGPIPLIYGKFACGSTVISSALQAEDIT